MASTSRHGGPSHTPEELADPDLPVRIKRAEIGFVDRKEEPRPGNSSNPSMPKQEKPDEQPKTHPRKAARTTGNRSKAQTPEDFTADSTDGDGQNSGTPRSDDFDF